MLIVPARYPRYYAENSDITNAESAEKKQALYLYNCAQRMLSHLIPQICTVLTRVDQVRMVTGWRTIPPSSSLFSSLA